MDEAFQADELAVRRLQHLLLERRRPISERRARAMLSAERELGAATPAPASGSAPSLPVYAPDTWRGAREQDRFFRSLKMYPLRADVQWALPARAGRPALVADVGADARRATPLWLQALLTGFEALALVTLVVVVALLYRRLRGVPRMVPVAAPTATATAQAPQLPGGHDPALGHTPGSATPRPTGTPRLPTATPAPTSAPRATTAWSAYPEPTDPPALLPTPPSAVVVLETPTLTPTLRPGTYIVIPAIGVDAPVVEGDSAEQLKQGVGHRIGTAGPGEPGNMVVSAHDDIYGEIFRDLDKLQPGDDVEIRTETAIHRYVVHTVVIVAPTEVQYMDPTDHGVLTMITCYPYLLDTQRVVVVADLIE